MATSAAKTLIPGYLAPGRKDAYRYLTPMQRLARGEWPWNEGVRSRLPEHFKRRYIELHTREPTPVHWTKNPAKWEVDEYGVRTHVENIPIHSMIPPIGLKQLWGGEGWVQAFYKPKGLKELPTQPALWKVMLQKRVFYSEILDQHLAIQVSFSTLDQVDAAFGFDNYILKTHEVDLRSKLGMKIKADMIRTLMNKSMYPNDSKKREEIYQKYKDYIVPEEELDWYGLDLREAEEKQVEEENRAKKAAVRPLKYDLMAELVTNIKKGELKQEEVEGGGFLSKLNPFK